MCIDTDYPLEDMYDCTIYAIRILTIRIALSLNFHYLTIFVSDTSLNMIFKNCKPKNFDKNVSALLYYFLWFQRNHRFPFAHHIQHFQRFSLADKDNSFVDEVILASNLNVRPKNPPASGARVQRTLPQAGSRSLNR